MTNVPQSNEIDKQALTESIPKSDIFNLLAEGVNSLVKSMDTFIAYFISKEEANKRDKRYNRLHSWGMVLTTILIALIGASGTMYKTSKENAQQRKFQYEQGIQEQLRQQIQLLDTQIHDKILKRDNLNNAMTQTRSFVEISALHCKNGKFQGDELKYSEKQIEYFAPMISSIYAINQIFEYPVYIKARSFLKLLDENKHLCINSKNFNSKLQILQFDTNQLTNSSIYLDQQKKEVLVSKLVNSF